MEFPSHLSDEEFRTAWGEWIAYRRKRKLTCTEETVQKQVALLATLGTAGAIEAIELSIRSGWQGLFEPKSTKSAGRNGKHVGEEEAAKIRAEARAGMGAQP